MRGGYRSADYNIYDRELPYFYYNSSDKKNGIRIDRIEGSMWFIGSEATSIDLIADQYQSVMKTIAHIYVYPSGC